MIRSLAPLAVLLLAAPGCALCSHCYDEAYPHYGGVVPRQDLFCGRVASAFTPEAGSLADVPVSSQMQMPAEAIAPGPVVEEPAGEAQESAIPGDMQPSLPEPEDRPPAAESLQNTLRGL